MKAFDTNALQLDPDFVGRLCETLLFCVKTKSRHARTRDGSLRVAAVWRQQQKAYLSAKVALPTTWPLMMMSTRYVPAPSALALRLYTYWQLEILKFEPVSAGPV